MLEIHLHSFSVHSTALWEIMQQPQCLQEH